MPRAPLAAIARAAGAAVVDGAILGAAIGLAELILVIGRSPLTASGMALTALITIGLAMVLGVALGAPLILALRGLGHHPVLAAIARELAQPGPARVRASTLVIGWVVAIAALGAATALVVLWVTARYRAQVPVAVLSGAMVVITAVALALLASAALPPLARAAARSSHLARATTGRVGVIVALVVAAALIATVDRVLLVTAPAVDALPIIGVVVIVAMLVLVTGLGPAGRLGGRRAGLAFAALIAVAGLALGTVGHAAPARIAISDHGLASTRVLHGLWALTDDDGDGFGDRFGARDCDDGDPAIHPHARDLAGDGVDGNCAGGDPDPATVAAARQTRPSADAGAPRHDLLLVTIDSLRADRTGFGGHRQPTTPVLDQLAARAAHFRRAYSPASLTRRALPALLYGRLPSSLPFSSSRRHPEVLANELPTLATTLAAAGYRTAALLSHRRMPLSAATYRGFAEVLAISDEQVSRHRDNADQVIDRALAWLAEPDPRPRLLWIHLIDPHYPYRPPAAAPELGPGATPYDREVAFVDAQLGRLLQAVSADRTIVAITADHGESFGEHHRRFHGRSLNEPEIHVPLLIAVPGAPPASIATPVSLLDLAPTFLDLLGLPTPAQMTGVSLATAIRSGQPPPPHPVVSELFANGIGGRELIAVQDGDHKLIRDLAAWTVVGFDVVADPGERRPIRAPATLEALTRTLEQALDRELAHLPALGP